MDTQNLKVSVFSHRRSGTHLTIDSLINNFKPYGDFISIDSSTKYQLDKRDIESDSVIFKSHSEQNLDDFFEDQYLTKLVRSTNIIYVYRDGRDVMASLYDYKKSYDKNTKGKSFATFIREKNDYYCSNDYSDLSRVEYWCRHVSGWLNKQDILFIKYTDWLNDYIATIEKIEDYLGIKSLDETKDVRVQGRLKGLLKKYFGKNKISSVHVNKGKTGRYVNYFDENDLRYYEKIFSKNFKHQLLNLKDL